MFNAVHSFIGAAALLRQGFYLQSAILVRSILEQTATVLHLVTTTSDLPRFKRGDLKVTAILRGAKRTLPPFGGLYGFFSENFVHMGPLHGSPQPLAFYQRHSDELDVTIGFLRTGVWIILVTTELLFIDPSEDRLYWKPRGYGQVAYDPSDETKQWVWGQGCVNGDSQPTSNSAVRHTTLSGAGKSTKTGTKKKDTQYHVGHVYWNTLFYSTMSNFSRDIIALVIALLAMILSLISIQQSASMPVIAVLCVVIGFIGVFSFLALSESIKVFIDVEQNTKDDRRVTARPPSRWEGLS
jgi:hypothetical protein